MVNWTWWYWWYIGGMDETIEFFIHIVSVGNKCQRLFAVIIKCFFYQLRGSSAVLLLAVVCLSLMLHLIHSIFWKSINDTTVDHFFKYRFSISLCWWVSYKKRNTCSKIHKWKKKMVCWIGIFPPLCRLKFLKSQMKFSFIMVLNSEWDLFILYFLVNFIYNW